MTRFARSRYLDDTGVLQPEVPRVAGSRPRAEHALHALDGGAGGRRVANERAQLTDSPRREPRARSLGQHLQRVDDSVGPALMRTMSELGVTLTIEVLAN